MKKNQNKSVFSIIMIKYTKVKNSLSQKQKILKRLIKFKVIKRLFF